MVNKPSEARAGVTQEEEGEGKHNSWQRRAYEHHVRGTCPGLAALPPS